VPLFCYRSSIMGKTPEEKAAKEAKKAAKAAKEEGGIVKLSKEEKAAKKAKKAANEAAAEGAVPVRESPRLAAMAAAASEVPELDDGFKVHKYVPPPEPEDETLQCRDCGGDFIFTVGEQEFFRSKGFDNKKTRCGDCTAAKKARFGEDGGKGKGKGKGGGGRGGGGRGGGDDTCFNCGEAGHRSYDCTQPRSGGKGKGKGGGGVCYAFQKGECSRGDGCRFSHTSA
jgi:hypothetical protein